MPTSKNAGIQVEGAKEMVALLRTFPKELQQELRDENQKTAERIIVPKLKASAMGGAPQARRVAQTTRAYKDRLGPKIKIGGAKRVTSRGTKAGVLLFGSAGGGSGRNFPGATDWITGPWEAGAALAVLANRKRMAKMIRKVS